MNVKVDDVVLRTVLVDCGIREMLTDILYLAAGMYGMLRTHTHIDKKYHVKDVIDFKFFSVAQFHVGRFSTLQQLRKHW
jgi:hypothetical protein